jgi:hypothetical protein
LRKAHPTGVFSGKISLDASLQCSRHFPSGLVLRCRTTGTRLVRSASVPASPCSSLDFSSPKFLCRKKRLGGAGHRRSFLAGDDCSGLYEWLGCATDDIATSLNTSTDRRGMEMGRSGPIPLQLPPQPLQRPPAPAEASHAEFQRKWRSGVRPGASPPPVPPHHHLHGVSGEDELYTSSGDTAPYLIRLPSGVVGELTAVIESPLPPPSIGPEPALARNPSLFFHQPLCVVYRIYMMYRSVI